MNYICAILLPLIALLIEILSSTTPTLPKEWGEKQCDGIFLQEMPSYFFSHCVWGFTYTITTKGNTIWYIVYFIITVLAVISFRFKNNEKFSNKFKFIFFLVFFLITILITTVYLSHWPKFIYEFFKFLERN